MNKTRMYISSSSLTSLDSKKINRNKFCGHWSLGGDIQEQDHTERHYSRLACKRWRCSRCGPKKLKRLRRAITQAAQEKGLSRFLTLTLNPSDCLAGDSIPYIRLCWNKFRTYLKRYCHTTISFIAVVELQQSGYAHLHLLIDRFILQAWISDAWDAVGGGEIVWIELVDIHRIGPYVTKYMTKEVLVGGFKKGQRRYTTSRDIPLFRKECSEKWDLLKAPIEFVHRQVSEPIVDEGHDPDGRLEWFRTSHPTDSPDSPSPSARCDPSPKQQSESSLCRDVIALREIYSCSSDRDLETGSS